MDELGCHLGTPGYTPWVNVHPSVAREQLNVPVENRIGMVVSIDKSARAASLFQFNPEPRPFRVGDEGTAED